MTTDNAMARIESWLDEPHRLYETFAIRGAAGSGKTQLLQDLAVRIPNSVFIDCQGLTAESVALRLLKAWQVECGSEPLFHAARRIKDGGVALLANVQWAGRLVSSNESSRITQNVLRTLKMAARPDVRFVVERSTAKSWVLAPTRNELVLSEGFDSSEHAALLAELLETHTALQALVAAETRSVPLSMWAELCRALDVPCSLRELAELTDSLGDVLSVSDGVGVDRRVAFRAESTRHRIRALHPVDHEAIVGSLRQRMSGRTMQAWDALGPLGHYTTRALPLHAAHAGVLESVLSDGAALANLNAYGLLQGMALAWPRGVPQGGIAIDAHYLGELGLASAPHQEWVAWLHQATVSRGNEALAGPMAAASVGLPWRTVWSRCRPFGAFGFSAPPYEEDSEGIPVSRSWPHGETAPPVRNALGAAHPFRAKRKADGEWLIAGPTGSFAVAMDTNQGESTHLEAMTDHFVGPITTAAEWEIPTPALAHDAPSQSWLEATFGPHSCRTLSEADLSDGLRDADARRFLATTGLPALSDQLPFMSTVDLREMGLVETSWPEESWKPDSDGPFYLLGEWTGGTIFLDGATGTVLQDYNTGYRSVALANSLRQFCTLLRLYHELLISNFNTPHEHRDARNSVRIWAEQVDSLVEDADHWEHVLNGDLDSWGAE
ncbi:SUKH-4 family immunity protein [Streptomyces sp. NPDC048638]|uniref:SUKH-4 family immunity protein n=1 Tax=Streptomyces sp. NPDC048638 TaxID=3365580 RepID=UPI00371A7D0E